MQGFDGNRLATLKRIAGKSSMSRRQSILQDISKYRHRPLSPADKALLARITTLQTYSVAYEGDPYGELFIHWFYRDRSIDALTKCEIFHLNMLVYFNVINKVEVIHIRCACKGNAVSASMTQALGILSKGRAKIDFKIVTQKQNWEHDTIKEAAEYAASSGKYVYYTHFKGVSRFMEESLPSTGRENVNPLDVAYWSYIMYEGLFSQFPSKHKAIGPIACNRINKGYRLRDLSWSTNPKYQYIGSFQSFDGVFLKEAFNRLGLDVEKRNTLLWCDDRYTVEMFLTLVFLENEVHSIAQLEGTSTAYKMYTQDFYPSLKEEFKCLYSEVNKPSKEYNHTVAICAVAKNEDPYIVEWIDHYLSLGVSHIYLYDNNNTLTKTVDTISNNPRVTVVPLRGWDALREKGFQLGIYREAYEKYGHLYGWMGFFDIDEFVDIDGDESIPEFLAHPVFDGTHIIHLHWRYYGDNGNARYEDSPVVERFPNPAPIDVKYANLEKDENRYVKSFIRTGYPEFGFDVHAPRFHGAVCRGADGFFGRPSSSTEPVNVDFARVNHYGTKSIEEYIRRRIANEQVCDKRASGLPTISTKSRLDWFFNVNEVTPQKLAVIKELLPELEYTPPRNNA